MTSKDRPNFTRTAAALLIFDQTVKQRAALWDLAVTEDDVRGVEILDKQATESVQEAFYQDTQHINSRSHAAYASIPFIRSLVARFPPDDAPENTGPDDSGQ